MAMPNPSTVTMRLSPTSRRCLGVVATPFIRPDGGRPNIAAKTLATLWYLLVLPDAQARLHRQLHHKRMPWYAPSRIIGAGLAALNICTMPLSWAFLFMGKRNASRLCALGVVLNPPSIMLSILLVTELSAALVKRSCKVATGVGGLVVKPFRGKGDRDDGDEGGHTAAEEDKPKPDVPESGTPKPDAPKPADESGEPAEGATNDQPSASGGGE